MTDAARVLYVSHSAVSQAIKSLEQLVNKPLFKRVGRRVVLNAAGKRYYRKVAPALEQVIEATEELARTPNDHRITLNMVNSLAMHWWIPRVPDFQAFAPSLDIRISTLTGPLISSRKASILPLFTANRMNGISITAKSSVTMILYWCAALHY